MQKQHLSLEKIKNNFLLTSYIISYIINFSKKKKFHPHLIHFSKFLNEKL